MDVQPIDLGLSSEVAYSLAGAMLTSKNKGGIRVMQTGESFLWV